jgi:ABC-type sugar transport system substrate-binding protein
MRALYVNPMTGDEVNPAIDAIAYGLQHVLDEAGIDLRQRPADFRRPDCLEQTAAVIRAGLDAGVETVCFYALDPSGPADAGAEARAAGVPVMTFVRPSFPVDAAVIYPNFTHGQLMAEFLVERLPAGSTVCIIGGPDTPDDAEEVAGLLFVFRRHGIEVLNDPTDPQWCNLTDVASGGYEVASRLLEKFDRFTALVPYNDESMLGAVRALEERGRLPDVQVISRNGSPEAVEMVRRGKTAGTWDLDAPGIGTTLGDLVVRQLQGGEQLDGHLAVSPVGRMITRETLDRWKPWTERVRYRPFTFGFD